jgi:hypothetical protein
MDDRVKRSLAADRVIDITTVGRTSGRPHRIETWFYRSGGRIYLTGSPGRRDWYANLLKNPEFTFHLKQSANADLLARAMPIIDPARRREIFNDILLGLDQLGDLERWQAGSPLVEVDFT